MLSRTIKVFTDMGQIDWTPRHQLLPFDMSKYINQDVETYYRDPDNTCGYTTRHYRMRPNADRRRQVLYGNTMYYIEYTI
jgi:hypothetical protein